MADIETLVIGGIIALISSFVTYLVSHYLRIREQTIVRDFEIREKGRDFFHQTYGAVTTLSDMVEPFSNKENIDEATILTENGYKLLEKPEIKRRYKEAYQKYSKVWYEAREKGLEIFLTKRFVKVIATFWAYASYFDDIDEWKNETENIKKFKKVSDQYCDEMDKLMGLCDKNSRLPKWLNLNKWGIILRDETDD